ncbi:MAG TPA: Tol-Pal system beta propeller repeat protein TolB [Candidatus Methylomirabilis sp.]|nr:Tol-Pal system beta propeller repeat protein TolB [Candidatus Methylomirabilis sp.]
MKRLWRIITCILLCGGLLRASASAQVDITVTRTAVQRIPIAVVGLRSSGGSDLAAQALSVLVNDLEFSTVFDVLPPSFMPFNPREVRLGEEEKVLASLNHLKVQAMVVAELTQRGKDLTLEGRVYNVSRGVFLGGKRYFGEATAIRSMVHRLADEVVLRLTGERGVASTRIAYASADKGATELYLMDYDGHNPTLATGNRSINLSPRFSPDGKLLAYTSYRDGNPDLYLLNLESGRRDKVSALPGLNIAPGWSPTGQWLALSLSKDGGTNLYLMRPTGGELRRLTNGLAISVSPSFSPTGRQIVFTSDRGGSPQVYMMDLEGTNLQRLTFEGEYNASARWSPRGDKIVFASNRGGGFQIYLMNPNGTGVQQLTTVGGNEDPAWSPDGRHLVFTSSRTGKKEIHVMHADGSEQKRLTQSGAKSFAPDWSP